MHTYTHTCAQTFSGISEASRARVSSRSWWIQNRLVTLATESFWLVVYHPLWKIWKSVGMLIPNIWLKIKNVPNHQPALRLLEQILLTWLWVRTIFIDSDRTLFFCHVLDGFKSPSLINISMFSKSELGSLLNHGGGTWDVWTHQGPIFRATGEKINPFSYICFLFGHILKSLVSNLTKRKQESNQRKWLTGFPLPTTCTQIKTGCEKEKAIFTIR